MLASQCISSFFFPSNKRDFSIRCIYKRYLKVVCKGYAFVKDIWCKKKYVMEEKSGKYVRCIAWKLSKQQHMCVFAKKQASFHGFHALGELENVTTHFFKGKPCWKPLHVSTFYECNRAMGKKECPISLCDNGHVYDKIS